MTPPPLVGTGHWWPIPVSVGGLLGKGTPITTRKDGFPETWFKMTKMMLCRDIGLEGRNKMSMFIALHPTHLEVNVIITTMTLSMVFSVTYYLELHISLLM